MSYNTYTLPNGLRIIHRPSASPVIYCGIAVGAGTRHELPGEEGLAHFCEHLTFKGTQRRTAVQIINAIEGVGGELNAFTNKEDTVFYAAVLDSHVGRAIDVLCDMVFHSQYPQAEVEKEREVVCDEIESYEDSPAELIFDEFENMIFSGHPLGHNILGTAPQVRSYDSMQARRFAARYYRPDNCVFFMSGGKVPPLKKLMAATADLPQVAAQTADSGELCRDACGAVLELPTERVIVRHRATHQAHVMLGARAFAVHDERRWALYLLNNILGGPGMNSRLNLSLRERRGLVYSVDSTMVSYSDTGLWCVYFGCDPHDADCCRRLVARELDRLMSRPLSPSAFKAAQLQLQGQLAIACDNREQFTLDFAKNFLHQGAERDLSHIMDHLRQLTALQLQEVAQELFAPDHLVTLIYQ